MISRIWHGYTSPANSDKKAQKILSRFDKRSQHYEVGTMKSNSLKKLLVFVSLTIILSLSSCISCDHPKPIPRDKEAFIGVWLSHSGFKMEIVASGIANVNEIHNPADPESKKLNLGVTPEYAKNMLVEFKGDSILIIRQPLVSAREYKIDQNPYLDGDTWKMILNGVLLKKQK